MRLEAASPDKKGSDKENKAFKQMIGKKKIKVASRNKN